MTLSVVLPVYNSELYLTECIESLCANTAISELIIVNDGSVDRSQSIIESWAKIDERISYYLTDNCGAGAARNFGISKAKSDYIGFVDSDDIVPPNYYSDLLALAEESGAEIVSGCLSPFRENFLNKEQYTEAKHPIELTSSDAFSRLCVVGGIDFGVPTKIFRKETLEGVSFENGPAEDYLFTTRAVLNAKTIVFDESIKYFYRQTVSSRSRGLAPSWDALKEINKIDDLIGKDSEEFKSSMLSLKLFSCSSYLTQCISKRFPASRQDFNKIYNISRSDEYKASYIMSNGLLNVIRKIQLITLMISPIGYYVILRMIFHLRKSILKGR